MTRKEQKELKKKKEQEFIESIKGKVITGKDKEKFRTTDTWKLFREPFAKCLDPITLKKLPKRWSLHHKDLNPAHYTDLNAKNFAPLGSKSHEYIHWLYGYYRKDRDILKRIRKILDEMVELNDGKDVRDYK